MSNWPLIVSAVLFGAWIVMTRMGKLAPAEAKRLVSEGAQLVDAVSYTHLTLPTKRIV